MELQYDIPNEKRLEPSNKMELFYWFFIGIIYPVFNLVTFFPGDPKMALLLFPENLLILPVYILYARIVFPGFLFQKKLLSFIVLSILFFVFIQVWVAFVYSIMRQFQLSPVARSFFSFTSRTLIREGLWAFINMFFVISIVLSK